MFEVPAHHRNGQVLTVEIRSSPVQNDQGETIGFRGIACDIPRREKELIFWRGYGKNTGFGAFLIREILALTNYTITETGTPGTGARFQIVVPQGTYRRIGRICSLLG